ncbi:hypothetical protein RhiirA4_489623, partial [Rhizophagus irregularis]
MNSAISVKINDDADKIEIDVDKNDVDINDADKIGIDEIDVDKLDDKIFTFDDEPHNGKPITMIDISPNEKYLATYSKEDFSIVGWNVEDIDKVQLKFHQTFDIDENHIKRHYFRDLCVSDDKKLAYIDCMDYCIIDMKNKDKKIALSFSVHSPKYCTFNLKGEFILYSEVFVDFSEIIWIYSTQTNNNKWECKRFYRIPKDYELISISKYDKVYL